MGKKEEYEETGCEDEIRDLKPYKVKYRIITEGEESVCLEEGGDDLNMLIDSLAMKAWNLGDFNVMILGKEKLNHIDE